MKLEYTQTGLSSIQIPIKLNNFLSKFNEYKQKKMNIHIFT